MLSILTQSPASILGPFPQPTSPEVPDCDWSELASIQDAIEPFASLYKTTGRSVRLTCILPTCYPRDAYYDLHDVHDLHHRSLLYLHSLVEELKAAGISTSYKLSPSVTPLSTCLVFAKDEDDPQAKMKVCKAVGSAILPREKILIASLEECTALVIT